MQNIEPIKAFNDNYIWLINNPSKQIALVVDPGDAKPVIARLTQQNLQLRGILITHHHGDHTAGVAELVEKYSVPVHGPKASPFLGITRTVDEGDEVVIDGFPTYHVLRIPGHTLDHIAYYTQDILLCGDTLFAGGCGRLFEGTAAQLYASLQRIATLPLTTQIYCAHEYTVNNLRFAQMVEPNNTAIVDRINQVACLRAKNRPSLPSVLSEEIQTNPFLRCDIAEVIAKAEQHQQTHLEGPVEVFAALRDWKNKV